MELVKKITDSRRWLFARKERRTIEFTCENTKISREIEYDGMGIYVYLDVGFNPAKKFNIRLYGDDYVNVYAFLTPYSGEVQIRYAVHRYDGHVEKERVYEDLTQGEKALIRQMANEISLKKTERNVNAKWFDIFCDVYR
jgi:hypothetical protein